MVKKISSKVVQKRKTVINGVTEYSIKCGEKMFIFSISENYVLIHLDTTIKDIYFSDLLEAKVHSITDDGSVYQIDLK